MALPAPRDLPVVSATWDPMRRAYLVALPGGLSLEAKDAYEVGNLVTRYAPYAAIRFVDLAQQRSAVPATPVAVPLTSFAPNTAGEG